MSNIKLSCTCTTSNNPCILHNIIPDILYDDEISLTESEIDYGLRYCKFRRRELNRELLIEKRKRSGRKYRRDIK